MGSAGNDRSQTGVWREYRTGCSGRRPEQEKEDARHNHRPPAAPTRMGSGKPTVRHAANLTLRARRAGLATLDNPLFHGDEAGETGYCASRIGRLLDRAEELGRLDALARDPGPSGKEELREWLVRC